MKTYKSRTERKTAAGYRGFVVHADQKVTLEEDLARRDLTMNAIAMDESGRLIDPFCDAKDILPELAGKSGQAVGAAVKAERVWAIEQMLDAATARV